MNPFISPFRPHCWSRHNLLSIDSIRSRWVVSLSVMHLLRSLMFSIVAALGVLTAPATSRAQLTDGEQNLHFAGAPSKPGAAALQQKAAQAQARIHANKDDRGALMQAIKTNEVVLAKQVLLRNGFTAEDLEKAKIILRPGGGKGGKDEIEISATCCEPKEITIQRSLENVTK